MKEKEKLLKGILVLIGSQTLVGRATAALSKDILKLPWPENGHFNLVPWEKELLDDVRDYMAEYVRVGQDSKLLLNSAGDTDIKNYSDTFLRLMNKIYPDMHIKKTLKSSGLMLIAFSFTKKEDSLSVLNESDWAQKIQSVISKSETYILRTQRVVRILTGNTLIIIKPDKLRYWIRSTAIRDFDDVMVEILKGGK
jgi:hypothetical protein